ncbi:hypothetical protein L211DRAFT_792736, partial [Terfezia boudieri ATCC MYA-4762]
FRTDFARLDTLRFVLGLNIPFGACTATAIPEKLRLIRAGLGIHADVISIVEPVNRFNLHYSVKKIQGAENGEEDLGHLIPEIDPLVASVEDIVSKIPSTIIYVDSITLGLSVATTLRTWLPPWTLIRPPHPKEWDADQYCHAGVTRILVATSAWGMGVHDPGVARVIQWKVKNLGNLDALI